MRRCCSRPLCPLCSLIRVSLAAGREPWCILSSSAGEATQSQIYLSAWGALLFVSLHANEDQLHQTYTRLLRTFEVTCFCYIAAQFAVLIPKLMEIHIVCLL